MNIKVNFILTRTNKSLGDGFTANLNRYMKVNKSLPWSKILPIIESGHVWEGCESFGTRLQVILL